MYHSYNKTTFESIKKSSDLGSTSASKDDILSYVSSLVNRSLFSEAIDYIGKIKLPAIAYADEFNLSVMEEFIRLLVFQGYHLKAETIIEKTKNRALDLYLSTENKNLLNLYVKFNVWDSTVKQALKRSYPSVPIFESLDNYFKEISDDLIKAQVYLQASHLNDFIGSQESFLKEALRLVLNVPKTQQQQPYIECQVLNALGVFYGLIGDLPTCRDILEECVSKATELGDRRRVAGSMINLANIYYLEMDQTPETQIIGRSMIQESIKISEEIECIEYATIGNLLLAEYYFKRGKSSQSLPYYERVYDLQTKRGIISNQEKIDNLLQRTRETPESDEQIDYSDKISR